MDRIVFVAAGGANRGIIQAAAFAELEKHTKKPLHELVDLFVGTSVGAINCGSLAAGNSGQTALDMFMNNDKKYFPKNSILWRVLTGHDSLFDSSAILDDYFKLVGHTKLSDLKTNLMTSAIDMNKDVTHYFKSDDPKDSGRYLINTISKAFAAPYFFGMIHDDTDQTTWCDAGAGTDNNPIIAAWTEVLARGWHLEGHVDIFVFGTGHYEASDAPSFKVTKKWGIFRQLLNIFMLASNQNDEVNVRQVEFYNKIFHAVDLHVIDPVLPPGTKQFGKTQYDNQYRDLGISAFNKAFASGDFACLLKD